jgi:hypothetical protein
MMVDDIQPQTNIEWLWTLDLVELSWEILRYRHLKKRILDVHRLDAIEAILRRLDGEGMPAGAAPNREVLGQPGPVPIQSPESKLITVRKRRRRR